MQYWPPLTSSNSIDSKRDNDAFQSAVLDFPQQDPGITAGIGRRRHFSLLTRRFWEPEFNHSSLNLSGWAKKITGKPTITVGSVGLKGSDFIDAFKGGNAAVSDLRELERRLQRHEFDLVAVGRALIADASWAKKVQQENFSEIMPFDPALLANL